VAYDLQHDDRLDPRLKAILAIIPTSEQGDVADREILVKEAHAPEAIELAKAARQASAILDNEDVAPSTGLRITEHETTSSPDGNTIRLRSVRPDTDEVVACVYYVHGGGMASGSIDDPLYRSWPRVIASKGVAVVAVEFRNAVYPNSYDEVVAFPGGLNDCLAGLRWVHEQAATLGVDTSRVVVAGESGGGNLTLAIGLSLKQRGELGLISGLYALCPYLVGKYPDARYPSTTENNGIFIELHNNRGIVGYGIEAYDAKDPIAWPDFASESDLEGLPPTVISVNECDPLRDEGIAMYRRLLRAGVSARGRELLGTFHGADLATVLCPEISHATALDLATFAKG
jgi:acetyl esterase